jgi:inosose dehydratase
MRHWVSNCMKISINSIIDIQIQPHMQFRLTTMMFNALIDDLKLPLSRGVEGLGIPFHLQEFPFERTRKLQFRTVFFKAFPAPLPNPVGYATIAWPNYQLAHALNVMAKLGFKGVELGGWIRQKYQGSQLGILRRQLNRLRLRAVASYCFPVNPLARTFQDESRTLATYAAFLRSLGGLYLEVTDDLHPEQASDSATVKALADRLSLLGRVAKDHGLGFGYHPHVGSLGETRKGFGRVLEASDSRSVGLIADTAHLQLGGSDPAQVIRTYHSRLLYVHFKDARQDAEKLARGNPALLRGSKYMFCAIGKGVVDFPSVINSVRDVRFTGWIIIELDGYQPPPGGPDEAARMNKQAAERLGLRV